MPGALVPPRSQPSTRFTLGELAGCGELASSQGLDYMVARLLAAAPGFEPTHLDLLGAALIVCDRTQICQSSFLQSNNVGLIVNMCGYHSTKFGYPPSFANRVATFSVNWVNGRHSQLLALLPEAAEVLASSQTIAIHCNQGFHRGPLGFAALAKMLFGIDPLASLGLLGTRRTIWHEYVDGARSASSDGSCWQSVTWLRGLTMYEPRPAKPVPVWGSPAPPASSQAASSSDQAAVPRQAPKLLKAARGKKDKKPKYLCRAMTASLTEFLVPGLEPNFQGAKLAEEMLDAVKMGSSYTSPFLYFSWDFHEARKWFTKGRELRGETTNLICQVEVAKLQELASSSDPASSQGHKPSLGDGLRPGQMLDLSSRESTKKFLTPAFITPRVEDKLAALGHAHSVKEVLVAWRGKVDSALFEVVDPDSGHLTVTVHTFVRTHNGRRKGTPSVTQQRAKIDCHAPFSSAPPPVPFGHATPSFRIPWFRPSVQ